MFVSKRNSFVINKSTTKKNNLVTGNSSTIYCWKIDDGCLTKGGVYIQVIKNQFCFKILLVRVVPVTIIRYWLQSKTIANELDTRRRRDGGWYNIRKKGCGDVIGNDGWESVQN